MSAPASALRSPGRAAPRSVAGSAARLPRAVWRSRRVRRANGCPRTGPVHPRREPHRPHRRPAGLSALAPRPAHFLVKQEMFHRLRRLRPDRGSARSRSTAGGRPHARSPRRSAVLARGGVRRRLPRGQPRPGRRRRARTRARRAWRWPAGRPVVPVAVPGHPAARRQSSARPPRPGRRLAVVFGDPIDACDARRAGCRRARGQPPRSPSSCGSALADATCAPAPRAPASPSTTTAARGAWRTRR